jgi:hypothetical protein
MWGYYSNFDGQLEVTDDADVSARKNIDCPWTRIPTFPVLVLKFDPASVQGMREKLECYLEERIGPQFRGLSEGILAALNITAPRRTKGENPTVLKDGRRVWSYEGSPPDPKAYSKAIDQLADEVKSDLRATSKMRRTKGKKGGRKKL